MSNEKFYYFGCDGQAGHYMFAPSMRTDFHFARKNPWGIDIDGGLLKGTKEKFIVAHKDGWTALAFWDNTVDTRPWIAQHISG